MSRTVLVLGATGLVGAHAVDHLLDPGRDELVVTLVRRATGRSHPRLREEVVDLDALRAAPPANAVLCAIGTTMKKAGSREAFRRVDHDIPLRVAGLCRAAGARDFALVSSVGADPRSASFYLRTKGELEEALALLGFPSLHVLRPSLLLGERREPRAGERVGAALSRITAGLMVGALRKYRAIDADVVARALVAASSREQPGRFVHEHDAIVALAAAVR